LALQAVHEPVFPCKRYPELQLRQAVATAAVMAVGYDELKIPAATVALLHWE